jgi:DNA-binding LacI/PurR family transcriptional regulator
VVGGGGFNGAWCDRFAGAAESLALPWVSLNPADEFVTSNFVAANHFQIGAIAGRLLTQTGKKRVAFVTLDLYSNATVLAQFSGLVQSFDRAGLPWSNLHMVRMDEPNVRDRAKVARQAAIEHVRAHGLPDAFLSSDQYLLGVLEAMVDLDVAVPDDVPVLGLTGVSSLAEKADPPLTTVNTPIDAIADNLVDMLLSMIRDKQLRVPGRYCPPGLTVRRSFAVPEDLEASIRAELGESVAADTTHRRKRRG